MHAVVLVDLPCDILHHVAVSLGAHALRLGVCAALLPCAREAVATQHGDAARALLASLRVRAPPHSSYFRRVCMRHIMCDARPFGAAPVAVACGATTRAGARCRRRVAPASKIGYCAHHDHLAWRRYERFVA
jgi:hypothetical protein